MKVKGIGRAGGSDQKINFKIETVEYLNVLIMTKSRTIECGKNIMSYMLMLNFLVAPLKK